MCVRVCVCASGLVGIESCYGQGVCLVGNEERLYVSRAKNRSKVDKRSMWAGLMYEGFVR